MCTLKRFCQVLLPLLSALQTFNQKTKEVITRISDKPQAYAVTGVGDKKGMRTNPGDEPPYVPLRPHYLPEGPNFFYFLLCARVRVENANPPCTIATTSVIMASQKCAEKFHPKNPKRKVATRRINAAPPTTLRSVKTCIRASFHAVEYCQLTPSSIGGEC